MIEIGERAAWMALMVRITTVCNGTRAREACEGSEPVGEIFITTVITRRREGVSSRGVTEAETTAGDGRLLP